MHIHTQFMITIFFYILCVLREKVLFYLIIIACLKNFLLNIRQSHATELNIIGRHFHIIITFLDGLTKIKEYSLKYSASTSPFNYLISLYQRKLMNKIALQKPAVDFH